MTDRDSTQADALFAALTEELSRLDSRYDSLLKDAGLTQTDVDAATPEALPPEARAEYERLCESAARAGKARAAQAEPKHEGTPSPLPGAARRNIIRM